MPGTQAVIQSQTALSRAQPIVAYLTPTEVQQLVAVATGRNGERDGLLIPLVCLSTRCGLMLSLADDLAEIVAEFLAKQLIEPVRSRTCPKCAFPLSSPILLAFVSASSSSKTIR